MAVLEQRARQEFDGASSVGARTAHARATAAARADGAAARRSDADEDGSKRRKGKARDLGDDLEYDEMEYEDVL